MRVEVLPVLKDMLITLATTLVLYFGLRKLLYKPVSEALNKRKENIKSDIDSAKIARAEAESLKLEYEKSIQDAKNEAQSIIESGRKRGEEVQKDIIAEARKEAEEIKLRGKKEAEAEKERALMDVRNQAGDMAVLIASKILESEVDKGSQQAIIDQFVNEVGNAKWQN